VSIYRSRDGSRKTCSSDLRWWCGEDEDEGADWVVGAWGGALRFKRTLGRRGGAVEKSLRILVDKGVGERNPKSLSVSWCRQLPLRWFFLRGSRMYSVGWIGSLDEEPRCGERRLRELLLLTDDCRESGLIERGVHISRVVALAVVTGSGWGAWFLLFFEWMGGTRWAGVSL